MSRPVIGITADRRNESVTGGIRQNVITGVPIEYVDCVVRSDGIPLLLPRTVCDTELLDATLDRIDALLLSGGGDLVSLEYGEEPHPATKYQDPVRDRLELALARLAVERRMPVLGICRGLQVLNVALGGTLVQDLPTAVANPVLHYVYARETVLAHSIDIEPNSLLAQILETTSTAVNSWHHQAVKDVANGLQVTARARDGVVEAIEADDGSPILGVQCHPEDTAADYPLFQKLFDWLVEQADISRNAARTS